MGEEKREAGEHGHLRLGSTKTGFALMEGGGCSSLREEGGGGWSGLTSPSLLLYPCLQHTFSPVFPPLRKDFPDALVQVAEKSDLHCLMLNMGEWVAFPSYHVSSASG